MSYVSIPFLSKREDAESLKRCIEAACGKTGVSQYVGTILMSFFLEEIALEVSRGHVVRIPGFGLFAAFQMEDAASVARYGPDRSKPVFSPARGFREEVRWGTPNGDSTKKAIIRHRRNHSLGSGESRGSARVFTAMNAIRENIAAQLGGVELED